jgi:hypothetical protein
MKAILRNWKTSLLGTGAIGTAISAYVQNPDDWKGALSILIVGLIGLFAKDNDKTGL